MGTKWRLDTDRWPGPNRKRWNITRDLVEPSPDGRFACVLYSISEIRLNCEVGLLTLLEGPPESPKVLLQPREFTCLDFSPAPSIYWLGGSRYAAVTLYQYNSRSNRVERLALTFLDTTDRRFALFDVTAEMVGCRMRESENRWIIESPAANCISPSELHWKRWSALRYFAIRNLLGLRL